MREIESRERAGEMPLRVDRCGSARNLRVVPREAVGGEPSPADRPPRSQRAAAVHENAEQPGAERVPLVVAAQCGERADEGVLDRVLGVRVIAEQVVGETQAIRMVPPNERGARRLAARARLRDAFGIVAPVRVVHGVTAFPAARNTIATEAPGTYSTAATPVRSL